MEPTPVELPWTEILKLAASTGLLTALLNQAIGWIREWRKESAATERDARYLALQIAVILERFSIDCADAITDNDLFKRSDSAAGKAHGTLPELLAYPTDVDWKALSALSPSLSARAISFRNELLISKRTIYFFEDVAPEPDPDLVHPAVDAEAGKCGYLAWQLAADLRRRYSLPALNPKQTSWDFVGMLKEQHDIAVARVGSARDD